MNPEQSEVGAPPYAFITVQTKPSFDSNGVGSPKAQGLVGNCDDLNQTHKNLKPKKSYHLSCRGAATPEQVIGDSDVVSRTETQCYEELLEKFPGSASLRLDYASFCDVASDKNSDSSLFALLPVVWFPIQ